MTEGAADGPCTRDDERARILQLCAEIQEERLKRQSAVELIERLEAELAHEKKHATVRPEPKELPSKKGGFSRVLPTKEGTWVAGKPRKVAEAWLDNYSTPSEEEPSAADKAAAQILAAVRMRAEAWRNGTAAVLAVITATLVIGGDTYVAIGAAPDEVAWCIVISAAAALVSLYLALRAANGPAFLDTKIRETLELSWQRDIRRAGAAAGDLKMAQWLLGLAVVLFLGGLLTLWLLD